MGKEMSDCHFLRIRVLNGTEFINLGQARKIIRDSKGGVIVWFSETDQRRLEGNDAILVLDYMDSVLSPLPK
jgi:hypothetical protein